MCERQEGARRATLVHRALQDVSQAERARGSEKADRQCDQVNPSNDSAEGRGRGAALNAGLHYMHVEEILGLFLHAKT